MASLKAKKSGTARSPKVATDRQFVTALGRGLAVLRCFDALRPQLGTTEIAQMTKMPQPTVWRLCYTLQQLGYLVQSPENPDKLRVGMAVLGLGQLSLRSPEISEMALPEMTRIARMGGAVSLAVHDQNDMLIIQRAQGDGPLLVNLAVGSRLPLSNSSAGWAYLAALPAMDREEALSKLKPLHTGKWNALRSAIESASAAYRIDGFVLNEGYFHPNVNAVGAAATDRFGLPQYVVNCGGPNLKSKLLRDEIGPAVAELARRISVALAARSS